MTICLNTGEPGNILPLDPPLAARALLSGRQWTEVAQERTAERPPAPCGSLAVHAGNWRSGSRTTALAGAGPPAEPFGTATSSPSWSPPAPGSGVHQHPKTGQGWFAAANREVAGHVDRMADYCRYTTALLTSRKVHRTHTAQSAAPHWRPTMSGDAAKLPASPSRKPWKLPLGTSRLRIPDHHSRKERRTRPRADCGTSARSL